MPLTLNCDKCNAEAGPVTIEHEWLNGYGGRHWKLPRGWKRLARAGRPVYLCPPCAGKEESRIQQQDLAEETL